MNAFVELEASWGKHRLPFRLRRAEVKRLRIVVDPEGKVQVTAPLHATDDAVIERVARRGDWIQRQRENFARWRPRTPVRQYLDGETHLLLGRQLRLQIERKVSREVAVSGGRLIVGLSETADRDAIRGVVLAWYVAQAKAVFAERLEAQSLIWRRFGVDRPRLIVRALRNRWGSMTAAGNLVLNVDLVRASPKLIDYVIAHELAHVLHPDHGQEWRQLLASVMPDWEDRKALLEAQLL